jgi:hypothetical protein
MLGFCSELLGFFNNFSMTLSFCGGFARDLITASSPPSIITSSLTSPVDDYWHQFEGSKLSGPRFDC